MKKSAAVISLALLITGNAIAQQPAPQPGAPTPDDPIGRYLVPPEMIMNHSQQLGLADKQKSEIKNEVRKAQERFFDLQWDMKDESSRLESLLQQAPINEVKVLEQVDKVLALEREIKRTHLTLLIRMKNLLTAEQNSKLDAIRKDQR